MQKGRPLNADRPLYKTNYLSDRHSAKAGIHENTTLPQRRGVNLPALRAVLAGRVGPQGVAAVLPRQVYPIGAKVAGVNLAVIPHGAQNPLRCVDVQAKLSCP